MNKYGKQNSIGELIIALAIGFVIVVSVPAAKAYLDSLINAVLTIILLAIVAGLIIFGVYLFFNRDSGGVL